MPTVSSEPQCSDCLELQHALDSLTMENKVLNAKCASLEEVVQNSLKRIKELEVEIARLHVSQQQPPVQEPLQQQPPVQEPLQQQPLDHQQPTRTRRRVRLNNYEAATLEIEQEERRAREARARERAEQAELEARRAAEAALNEQQTIQEAFSEALILGEQQREEEAQRRAQEELRALEAERFRMQQR
ncbi:hypothetical protein PCE1_002183 [Barthelona sp. PCE]